MKNSQAQENQNDTHYYYIEESSYDALKSTNIRENQDGTISLEFENESLTSFFENFTIYSYVREFEWSRFTSLHKYYLIELDETNKEASLLLNSNIITAEYAGTLEDIEGKPLDTPNDYFVDNLIGGDWIPDGTLGPNGELLVPYFQTNIRGYEHLELINARRAWNITTGAPNIIIGVRDGSFNNIHPEIVNKISAEYGTISSTGGAHGLSVSATAGGDTNNGTGYTVSENDNAYLILTHTATGVNYNYVLNSETNAQNIPIDQLQQGAYVVNLVVNGNILDAKHLIII